MSGIPAGVATHECPSCEVDVPDGNFCGRCGCQGGHLKVMRPKTFGAAPSENVLLPYLLSSLFPQLPTRSRRPFRLTLFVAAVGLLLSAILRLPALGIAISALGLPLLFVLYLRASGIDREISRVSLIVAAVAGAVLGAAWVFISGHVVSRAYGVPMAVGLALHHMVRAGFVIPAIGIVLMILPVVLIRWVRPGKRHALDGFVIGALAGLFFSAAATLVRLAPQVTAGLFQHVRPVIGMVVEVVLCGFTVPITAAAAAGMVGTALWFRQQEAVSEHHRRVGPLLALLAVTSLLLHAAVGVVDIIGLPQLVMLFAHIILTLVVLVILRATLQLALLHEHHDPIREDQPLLCPYCDMVVPDMAFCPSCGAATRASSQESRRERAGCRIQTADAEPTEGREQIRPGYAMPAASYLTPAVRRPRFSWLLSRWGVAIMTVAAVLGTAALVLTPKIAHYMCPPDCGKPPTGTPVMALPRYDAPDGSFSVSYPAPGAAYNVTTTASGVTATYTGGDGGVLQLFSEPARGREPRDIARALLKRTHPDAKVEYEIPNAMVGYQPGYGEVADDWPQGTMSGYSRVRILLMTAVKNDVALVAFATGPYHAFGPDFGPGPPSGANLELAGDMGKYVNSFRWKGDPAR